MNRTRKLLLILAATTGAILLAAGSCETRSSGDRQDAEFTERAQRHFAAAQPPHAYDASQARENLIAAQDAMAYGADTWTVQYVEGVGVTFECPSVGFPIPFGTNLTNPVKAVFPGGGASAEVPLMEPYGLYPPADVAATYANCVLPDGTVGIFYSEPLLTAYGFDVDCDEETRRCTIPTGSRATISAERVDPAKVNARDANEPGN